MGNTDIVVTAVEIIDVSRHKPKYELKVSTPVYEVALPTEYMEYTDEHTGLAEALFDTFNDSESSGIILSFYRERGVPEDQSLMNEVWLGCISPKNLGTNLTREELVELFERFECFEIMYMVTDDDCD